MNPLVKKEIRLLLPSWIVAVLLAMVQGITRPYNFYVASLLFFGLTIMALTTIGREASLNTFSSLLAQPAERLRIWKIKLSVLAAGFATVFALWLVAFGFAWWNSNVDFPDRENSYNLFITVCLIAAATFTGGLWTTLLLRQLAGAFWLTLLVPAVLSGFSTVFFAESESSSLTIAVLSVVIAVYSVGGFLLARWLFFRAQDVGWSGGNLEMPDWKIISRPDTAVSLRNRKPFFALLKKEFKLQQVSLFGAAGILAVHIGVIVLRKYHHFNKDSAGEVLTGIFWMVWLVLAPAIGSMAVAEERRLGVMEGQLCLPVSRRVQFAIKGIFTLALGIFLGGIMPILLEYLAARFGALNSALKPEDIRGGGLFWLPFGIMSTATWLSLLGFFGSTLSRSFLQAVGFGIVTFFVTFSLVTINWHEIFHPVKAHSILPMVIAVPTIIVTLLWLAYLNFKNFRPGWPLWRRNLLGVTGAFVFVIVTSAALYNRVWEVFEPAEPAHGAAKLSLANPPTFQTANYQTLLVRLPDGRVWFDGLGGSVYDYYGGTASWKYLWQMLAHPLTESLGPQKFLAGSNWVAATTTHLYFHWNESSKDFNAADFMETVGIQPDGTLWLADKPTTTKWTPGKLRQFGSETNWQQLAQGSRSVVLLKSDGTLWRWGYSGTDALHQWPGLRTFTPYQIGTNADWQELFTLNGIFARRTNGQVWHVGVDWKTGKDDLSRTAIYDEVVLQTASRASDSHTAFVRADGTLWVLNRYWDEKSRQTLGTDVVQVGKEKEWRSVAVYYVSMVALKADGSLWQWNFKNGSIVRAINNPPNRLSIHNDWLAITGVWNSVIALAADGSLWLWPDKNSYEYRDVLLKLPKQPQLLGNVFSGQH